MKALSHIFVIIARNFIFKYLIICSLIVLCLGCEENRLKASLRLAGENRKELEKILSHYKINEADSLKFRAACFLIENAIYHYSLKGKGVDDFRLYFDSLVSDEKISQLDITERIREFSVESSEIYPDWDIRRIKSNFLIPYIDSAFLALKYPWAEDISFDDFCEYILPYRIGNEDMEDWMTFFREYNADIIKELLPLGNDKLAVSIAFHNALNQRPFVFTDGDIMKFELNPSDYVRLGAGDCSNFTKIALYAYRSIGIPIKRDYLLHWANRSMTHFWNSIVIDSINHSFVNYDMVEFGKHLESKPKERMGKVYRKMFSFQPESLVNQRTALKEEIPGLFKDPYIKDVSELYFDAIDVRIPLAHRIEKRKRFVYLMVFDNQDWVPIGWGRIRRGEAVFENIEKGCTYLAMYYHEGRYVPATYPFSTMADGTVRIYTPKKELISAELKRKYPAWDYILWERVNGGKFQISNNPEFRNAKTIYTVGPPDEMRPYYVDIDESSSFRYIRYLSAPWSHVFVAELELYDTSGEKLKGRIIGTDGSFMDNGKDKYNVFDGDPLTIFDAPFPHDGWVGMAFDSPQKIGSLMYLPHNDDNYIRPDEEYELYYWNDGEFVSLGKRIGDKTFVLEYDNVPENALLLLRNHTKGKEERIFTYEDGKQIWW